MKEKQSSPKNLVLLKICNVCPKVYLFLDLLKVRYVLPPFQHFIMENLLGFWMVGLSGVIYDI